jgi:hypothetical protein
MKLPIQVWLCEPHKNTMSGRFPSMKSQLLKRDGKGHTVIQGVSFREWQCEESECTETATYIARGLVELAKEPA